MAWSPGGPVSPPPRSPKHPGPATSTAASTRCQRAGLNLSVTVASSDTAARNAPQAMRTQLAATEEEPGLSQQAYGSATGRVIAAKDDMVLDVDATALPDDLGNGHQRRLNFALGIALVCSTAGRADSRRTAPNDAPWGNRGTCSTCSHGGEVSVATWSSLLTRSCPCCEPAGGPTWPTQPRKLRNKRRVFGRSRQRERSAGSAKNRAPPPRLSQRCPSRALFDGVMRIADCRVVVCTGPLAGNSSPHGDGSQDERMAVRRGSDSGRCARAHELQQAGDRDSPGRAGACRDAPGGEPGTTRGPTAELAVLRVCLVVDGCPGAAEFPLRA